MVQFAQRLRYAKKEIFVFLLIMAVLLASLVPVNRHIRNVFASFESMLRETIRNEAGLDISFDSASLGILRNLTFRNVTVSNASNGAEIFKAGRVSLSVRLFKLLRGDFFNSIRNISIENGKMELEASNLPLSLSAKDTETTAKSFAESIREKASPIAKKLFANAASISIRNFSILSEIKDTEISCHIDKAAIGIDEDKLSVNSLFSLNWDFKSINSVLSPLDAKFSVDGELSSDLSSAVASVLVESIGFRNIYLSKIGLVAGLKDSVLSIASMQEGQPISLSATVDYSNKSASVDFLSERLRFFRLISSGNRSSLSVLENMALSATASLAYSEQEGLKYMAEGSLDFPAGFLDTSGGTFDFDFSGNLDRADISSLTLLGDDFDARYSGSFNIETMLADGLLSVKRFSLFDSALEFSGDFSISSFGKTLSLAVPALSINGSAFYNVTGRADFSSSGQYEFSLSADDQTGSLLSEGVFFLGPDSFLQAYAAFDSLSVENSIKAIPRNLLNEEAFDFLSYVASSLALTAEVYASTDFERFAYNSPSLTLSSKEDGDVYFVASISGTESVLDIVDISASPAEIPINGNIYTDFERDGKFLFASDFSVSGIPYSLSGSFEDGIVSAYGDYGLSFLLQLPARGRQARGSVFFNDLPLQVGPATLSLSLDANFAKRRGGLWGGNINSFSVTETSGLANFNTVFSASGVFDSSSITLKKVSLSDELSSLSGLASISFIKDSLSDSSRIALNLSLSDSAGSETIAAEGFIASGRATGTRFETQVSAQRLPLMRFVKGQQADNFISANISITGAPDAMLASVNIPELSVKVGNSNMNASVSAMYKDDSIIVSNGVASWGNFRASDIKLDFSTADLSGTLGAMLSGVFASTAFSLNLQGNFQGNTANKTASNCTFGWASFLGDAAKSFYADFELSDMKWRDITIENPLLLSIERVPGITVAYAGNNDEFSARFLDGGDFTISLIGDLPLQFKADGSAAEGSLDVDVSDVDVDMARFWPIWGLDLVEFVGGHVVGDFHIGGLVTDPDFEGILNANNIVVRSPDYFPTPFDPASFLFIAEGNEIWAPKFIVTGNGGALEGETVFYFNRWMLEQIDLFVRNIEDSRTAAVVNHKYVRARGDIFCDIIFTWTPDLMEVTGDAGFENGHFAILFENIGEEREAPASYDVIADLNVHMGRKVEFRWPSGTFPVMRALVQANEPFHYSIDTALGEYSFKGTGALKGGDFFYFKRSFYLRDGSITFDETQDQFDPVISLRAEVRERDENGSPVRITMTVDNDPLSSFNPVFTSDPFKNQVEIMEILGQVATADTTTDNPWRDLAVTGTDLLSQLGVFRPAENFIRDKLNLDIFSIRTLILQNAVFGTSLQGTSETDRWTAGNFLDNTTLYLGKYFGSIFYVDALLQFSYYDSAYYQDRVYRNTFFPTVFGNLLFLPEIGIEVETPFAHIRWGISPVPNNNNVTLSWRFAY